MAIIYSKKYKTDNRREVLNPAIEQGLRRRYGLLDISRKLAEIKERALGIQSKLGTLREAEKAGMTITPKTSVEEAKQFLKPKLQPEPKVGYVQPTQPKVDYIQPPVFQPLQIQMPQLPKTDVFDKLKDFLTKLLPTKPKVEVPDIAAKSKALADVQKEIADTEKKYLLTAEKWRNEAMAKGLTMPYLRGKLGQLERQRDIEMTSLYAKQRALQGDLANAQKLAQYAADLAQDDFNNKLKIVNLALDEASREASSVQKQYIEALRNQFDLYKQQMNRVYQLMVQYPDAGILPSDDWQTIQDKIKQSALYRKKTTTYTKSSARKVYDEGGGEKGWGMPFSKWYKEVYKGREEGKEETYKPFWTKTDYKNLAGLGIPKDVADTVAVALQEGLTLEAIRRALAEEYGRETGYHYLDVIMPYLQKIKTSEDIGFSLGD